jgi:hypothetical protein
LSILSKSAANNENLNDDNVSPSTTSSRRLLHPDGPPPDGSGDQGDFVPLLGTTPDPVYLAHGIIMWVAWGVFAFVQIITGRYLTCYWQAHMWIHMVFGTLVALITIAGAIVASNSSANVDAGAHA